jgi:hypothetical protein
VLKIFFGGHALPVGMRAGVHHWLSRPLALGGGQASDSLGEGFGHDSTSARLHAASCFAADIGTPEKPRRLLCDDVNDAPSEEGKSPGLLESHNG